MVDAAFGEVMVTCEKISWLLREGERWLQPERRSPGVMVPGCLCIVTHTASYRRCVFSLLPSAPLHSRCSESPCEVTITASILASCGACEHAMEETHLGFPAQMFYKSARVEYHPLGVVGAIVPWNYPFHNVFNPLTAALFAGNALVIKVSPSFGIAAGCAEHVAAVLLQYLLEVLFYTKHMI